MRPGIEPHRVSDIRPFESSTLACLEEQPAGSFSGVSKDGTTTWIVRGSLIEVVEISSGKRCAAWQFGRILSDEHTSISCVEEFALGQTLKLLVGVCNASPVGLLCVFDVSLSKVIKAVEIPNHVTELELVSTFRKNQVPRWALSEHLSYFCGLVAVGTNTGKVYLVDMCTDDNEFFSDEEVPSKLHFISPRIRDIENQRFHCMSQGLHLAMALNESMISMNGFEYQKPDGLVMKTFRPDCVSVTCLTYIAQAGILVVGFSFGCYQLWKLNVPVLEYSSRLEPEHLPVTHVAYQEPDNDPKNFCYIWVARGQKENEDEALDSVSSVSMYQLAFSNKSFYSNYGVYYEDLTSVCLRLDHDLTSTLVQFGSNYDGGSRVVSCYTLADPFYQPPTRVDNNDSFEENSPGPDLSLCVFVWEATEGSLSSKVGRHLAIFDINRWYHSQMPATIRYASGSTETCAYFCSCRLDEAAEKAGNDGLLIVHVSADRLRKFFTNAPVPPEQHFYPASLAFDASLVFETGVVKAQYLGSQRQVIASMETKGPSTLIQPLDLYNLCVHVGLLPRPVDIASSNPSIVVKRELLLGVALEYNMVSFLKACVVAWAGGEYEHHGCTLKFMLDWAWDTVSNTKHKIDSICVSLYNWSGLNLDQRSLQTLVLCNQRLAHLVSLFKTFLVQSGPITEQGETELQNKVLVTSLLSQHVGVVLWFVGAGLLPEDDDTEVTLGGLYCYPATSLMSAYKNRRAELQNIHSDIQETNMLMIDGLVEVMGAKDLWEREGGTGLYPPPSLHAILSAYLLENCDMLSKHSLVLYLLLDLVSVDSSDENETFSEKVSGFARRFNLPQSLVKLIQAFWLLDHRDFEEALNLMLDPIVRSEFSRWQHKRTIKALLYQGDAKMALRYITSINPALTTPEEVKLKLTVLLANGLTAEALEYQRMCRDKNNMNDLLSHLFLGCQQTKTVDRLLQLPLTSEEETILVDYLLESPEPRSQEFLVMHYLQRARFIEAIQLNEKLKHSVLMEASSKARERAAARNAIVDSYAGILPHVQRRLMYEQIHIPKKNMQWRREVRRPTPLSTKITINQTKVMSQSAFIMSIMEKLDEIETEQPPTEVLDRSVGPFICTPVTPARQSRRDTPATVYPESACNINAVFSFNQSRTMFSNTDSPTGVDRRTNKFFSANCLTVLQTPIVTRVTPRKKRLSSSNTITPQSILKVRHMIATTSPSPHSANTTPNSQELEASVKKLPRKLGYGAGATPLTSIPRRLVGERSQTTSQPSSPKSVSFVEPSSPESPPVIAPRHSITSQPTTPKSVSFVDKSIRSSSELQTHSTLQYMSVSQTQTAMMQGSFAQSKWSPKSSTEDSHRSVRNRSPTPERSPTFADNLDQLHRRPLHTPPKQEYLMESNPNDEQLNSPRKEELPVNTSTKLEDDLVLHLEASDENISDDNVEEMEESFTFGVVSSASADVSVSSTATVREQIEARAQLSPVRHSSHRKSLTKHPSSPTVKISKSPVSVFISENRKSSTEHAQSDSTSTEHAQTGTMPEIVVEQTGTQVDIDLTEDDDMEVDQSVKDVTEIKQIKEIFDEYEELNPPGEVEEMEREPILLEDIEEIEGEPNIQGTLMKGEQNPPVYIEEMENVSSSGATLNQSMKEEVVEELFATPPEPVRQLLLPVPPDEREKNQGSPLHRKGQLPPSQRLISPLKTKDSPPDSDYGVQSIDTSIVKKSSSTYIDNILAEIDDKFADSPVTEDLDVRAKYRAKSESEHENTDKSKVSRIKHKFDISVIKLEQEPSTSSRETDEPHEELPAPVEAPVTPTRSSMRGKIESDEISQEPVTPRRSTRGSRKQAELSPLRQQKVTTPTRSSSRRQKKDAVTPTRELRYVDEPLTPSRSTRQKTLKSEVKAKLTEISAESPKPFSPRAREAVQQSLIQISEDIHERTESSPGEMTKIKVKAATSPPRTPTRSRRGHSEMLTPTRVRTRLSSKSENTDNEENVPLTPSRSTRNQKNKTLSPSKEAKTVATPKRRQKKMDEVSSGRDLNDNNNRSVSPSKDEVFPQSVHVKRTPTRRRKKPEESIIEVIPTVEPKTPPRQLHVQSENADEESRRDSFGMSDIPTDFEDITNVDNTPSRRHTLTRSCKKGFDDSETMKISTWRQTLDTENKIREEIDNVKTPTRRRSLGRDAKISEESEGARTPTRRRSLGRIGKSEAGKSPENEVHEEIKSKVTVSTPSRRGRPKKTEDSTDKHNIETKVVTPSRKGQPKKVKSSESEDETVGTKQETQSALSRSKRQKKDDRLVPKSDTRGEDVSRKAHTRSEDGAPAAHTRSEDVSPKAHTRSEDGSPAAHTRSHDTEAIAASIDLYDIQTSSFQFSDPMQVEAAESTVVKPFTPTKSFIFSPPISHTRSVIKEELVSRDGILLPPGPSLPQVTEETDAKPEKKTKRKMKRLYNEREELLLISPLIAQAEGDSGEDGRGIVTRSTHAGAKKVLTKADGTQLVIQSMRRGRRTRTSHRFGPVGQKKTAK